MTIPIITVVFCLTFYAATVWYVRGITITTKDLCVGGILTALTVILETIYIPLPTGATICLCSPVPLMLMALVWDKRLAVLCGFLSGVLVIFFVPGWQPVHWGQFFVEHMICFSCLGFSGMFGTKKRWHMACGLLVASTLKFLGHVISGAMFFSQNAWDGWGAWGYSLAYNVSQSVPLCLISALIILALPLKSIRRSFGKETAV